MYVSRNVRIFSRMFSSLPYNEPPTNFTPGSKFREELTRKVDEVKSSIKEVPLVINGKKIFTQQTTPILMPSDTSRVIGKCSQANAEHIREAIEGSLETRKYWKCVPFSERESIFKKACYLLTTKYRSLMLATCMIDQAKTAIQADIDCICELSDFIRFNLHYAENIYSKTVLHQPDGIINTVTHRPLEGFVAAISPFNFTAIAGNLCSAPSMVGNVVLWKPSEFSILSNYLFYEILIESGLPKGVIQFLPSDPTVFGEVFKDKNFSCLTFTGSTLTFKKIWKQISANIDNYVSFPVLIGELGGKNFHLVHESADLDLVVNATIRGAYEYCGQKCSACSNVFIPTTMRDQFVELMRKRMEQIKLGQPDDYKSFLSAVISPQAFSRIKSYIDMAQSDPSLQTLVGGKCDNSKGYFIEPTLIQSKDLEHRIMREEIFGPVCSFFAYNPEDWEGILYHVGTTSKYALTGSVFCRDRKVLQAAEKELIDSCGNFYVNDKCTGSIVGQQPFGGARHSGTNDKAGMGTYLLRYMSPMARKENLNYYSDVEYPYMK